MRLCVIAVGSLLFAGILAFEGLTESTLGVTAVTQTAAAQCIENPIDGGCLPCPRLPRSQCTM